MSEERLIRWASGDEDRTLERSMLDDPALAEEAYASLELDDALREATRRPRRALRSPRRWVGGLVAVAAVLLAVFGPLRTSRMEEGRMRSPSAAALELIAPRGEVATFPRTFTWKSTTADARFRWELYDPRTRPRAVEVVGDTLFVLAAESTPTDSLGTWRWLVVELRADGTEGVTSEALQFEVRIDR